FGTKLLSLWDDVTKGDKKLIFQPTFFLPLLSLLVGYFVALAAFYTLRSIQEGQVRVTAPESQFVQWQDGNGKTHDNGVTAATLIQFSGAADFPDDISVLWDLRPKGRPVGAPVPPAGTLSPTGLLTVPDATWVGANGGFLDW